MEKSVTRFDFDEQLTSLLNEGFDDENKNTKLKKFVIIHLFQWLFCFCKDDAPNDWEKFLLETNKYENGFYQSFTDMLIGKFDKNIPDSIINEFGTVIWSSKFPDFYPFLNLAKKLVELKFKYDFSNEYYENEEKIFLKVCEQSAEIFIEKYFPGELKKMSTYLEEEKKNFQYASKEQFMEALLKMYDEKEKNEKSEIDEIFAGDAKEPTSDTITNPEKQIDMNKNEEESSNIMYYEGKLLTNLEGKFQACEIDEKPHNHDNPSMKEEKKELLPDTHTLPQSTSIIEEIRPEIKEKSEENVTEMVKNIQKNMTEKITGLEKRIITLEEVSNIHFLKFKDKAEQAKKIIVLEKKNNEMDGEIATLKTLTDGLYCREFIKELVELLRDLYVLPLTLTHHEVVSQAKDKNFFKLFDPEEKFYNDFLYVLGFKKQFSSSIHNVLFFIQDIERAKIPYYIKLLESQGADKGKLESFSKIVKKLNFDRDGIQFLTKNSQQEFTKYVSALRKYLFGKK